eukprot:TRINITY_DN54065_c0_g1_i1.p1 TRINITY_DN54065_c0_g1~~TRINITY_DN54065_c0_g1_i1.p1  ORF type:complete len:128 (-),score=1.98 TRINITY_DN54065_c0_g1_i1:151-534(-)
MLLLTTISVEDFAAYLKDHFKLLQSPCLDLTKDILDGMRAQAILSSSDPRYATELGRLWSRPQMVTHHHQSHYHSSHPKCALWWGLDKGGESINASSDDCLDWSDLVPSTSGRRRTSSTRDSVGSEK